MSYHFIEKKDPHVEILFQGLENLERMLSDMEKTPKPMFKGERFLTDEELSGILRISRRTLQESVSSLITSFKERCSTRNPTYRRCWRMPTRDAGKNRGGYKCKTGKWRKRPGCRFSIFYHHPARCSRFRLFPSSSSS